MAKKIGGYIKLEVAAGQANPSPPVGPALGQRGVNIMEFCKAFNAATQNLEAGIPIPTVITVFVDKSFAFITKSPPASFFIKRAARRDKGASEPGREVVGYVTRKDIKKIAEEKMKDLNANDLEGAMRMIEGSARSMGIDVRG